MSRLPFPVGGIDGVRFPDSVAGEPVSKRPSDEMPKTVARCPNQIRVRFSQFTRGCGRSLYYPQLQATVGAYHPYWGGLICPPCASVDERMYRHILDRWPGFDLSWEPYDPEDDKTDLQKANAERRMRHAIRELPPPRLNGLVRQDGSGAW